MPTPAPVFLGNLADAVVMRCRALADVTARVQPAHIVYGWLNADEAEALPSVSVFTVVEMDVGDRARARAVSGQVQVTVLARRLPDAVAIARAIGHAVAGASWTHGDATYSASRMGGLTEQPGDGVHAAVITLDVRGQAHALA